MAGTLLCSAPSPCTDSLDNTSGNEPVSPGPWDCFCHRRSALAVAQEDGFVPSPRRHRGRPPGIHVHVSGHDHADRQRGSLAIGLADAAVMCK